MRKVATATLRILCFSIKVRFGYTLMLCQEFKIKFIHFGFRIRSEATNTIHFFITFLYHSFIYSVIRSLSMFPLSDINVRCLQLRMKQKYHRPFLAFHGSGKKYINFPLRDLIKGL